MNTPFDTDAEPGVEVAIRLPLSLDVTGEIMSAIGAKYPNTMIRTVTKDGAPARDLLLWIPDSDRYYRDDYDDDATPEDEIPPAKKRPESSKDLDGQLAEMSNESLRLILPEEFSNIILGLAREMFDAFPDAPNYLEMSAVDKATNRSWLVTVHNPEGLTPHQLRRAAEQRAIEAELALQEAFTPEALEWLAQHPDPKISGAVSAMLVNLATDEEINPFTDW